MATRYDYENLDEFVKDRAMETHLGLRAAHGNEALFGQIVRNVLKHAFQCGAVYAGGDVITTKYE